MTPSYDPTWLRTFDYGGQRLLVRSINGGTMWCPRGIACFVAPTKRKKLAPIEGENVSRARGTCFDYPARRRQRFTLSEIRRAVGRARRNQRPAKVGGHVFDLGLVGAALEAVADRREPVHVEVCDVPEPPDGTAPGVLRIVGDGWRIVVASMRQDTKARPIRLPRRIRAVPPNTEDKG